MEKKVEKYDKEVKTQIALSKNGQNKRSKYINQTDSWLNKNELVILSE